MKSKTKQLPINIYIRILVLTILIFWSFKIIEPFVLLLIWSVIVAVTLYPSYRKVVQKFSKKRKKLATGLFTLVILLIIIIPTAAFVDSIVDFTTSTVKHADIDNFDPNELKDKVKDVPLIGDKLQDDITEISKNFDKYIEAHTEQLKKGLKWGINLFKGIFSSLLLSLVAIIVSGLLLFNSKYGYDSSVKLAEKLVPQKGKELIDMCTNTIRGVVKGIILVGIIQAVLAYIGFAAIGLGSLSGILALCVLIVAIIQLPVSIVVLPIIAYVFSFADTTPAIIFSVYILLIGLVDNILKPIFFSKGMDTPMIIILIGALGGMVFQGLLGLFIGPVVLAITHNLYNYWINHKTEEE